MDHEFKIKDLGRLNYFLGLEVLHTDSGLFLGQSKYAHDIVSFVGLLDSKLVSTPLSSATPLVLDGRSYDNPNHYWSLVGALQYLTITRTDIAYMVNQVIQFLKAPSIAHFQAVKILIHYIKGTLSFGLTFTRPTSTNLVGNSDTN
ncbi:uncharacterized mitochondrial protein AtMg00810-like [Lactuca sativa]|uniref:uncharacterized mitochondrial protein AtMg00810-like n=1 Tax=Lactuca sativa TaxID=4236 RepID=UPI000CD93323|nr:uncharacterized mitochondrial protein AtMg00810-like [Lactuca sativa]